MTTLVQTWLAETASDSTGLHSGEDPAELRFRTWAQVRAAAGTAAAGLAGAGVGRGGRVAILAGDPGDVADLVQATWLRGAAFTMLHQPTPRAEPATWLDETRAVIGMLEADVVVVGDPFAGPLSGLDLGTRVVSFADLIATDPAVDGEAAATLPAPCTADDLAVLQLTSGSTGTPKAVAITFGNIEANHRAMVAAVGKRDDDVSVSWLPLFHDMGMIGLLILPMIEQVTAVITTPTAFLRKPQAWAELITRFGGTCTAAPNFAYAVLAKRLRRAKDGAFDLSTLRIAINGAEPIDESSLQLFLDEGARFGLRCEVALPCYGMAEATLAVSFDDPARRYRVDAIDPAAAEAGDVQRTGATDRTHVRLGQPVPGIEVAVVGDDGSALPADRIGTLLVRGAAVTTRYLRPEGFEAAVDTDGWLDTGDLGYRTPTGEVVVTGRKKDVIIVSGRNLSPTVIERAVATVDGVRPGNAAAVAYRRAGSREGIAVVAEAEVPAGDVATTARMHDEISRAVFDAVGVPVAAVALIGKGELPKTTSGKIRRHSAAALIAAATA